MRQVFKQNFELIFNYFFMQKISGIVGIIESEEKEKNIAPKKKKIGQPTLYWKSLVEIWFKVYAELIPTPPGEEKAKPCFDTVESMQMKIILRELRKRAEEKNIEWTEEEAKKRWEAFLRHAFLDDWISRNFMLRIISTNKTKIFNNQITQKRNGGYIKNNSSVGKTIQFDKP